MAISSDMQIYEEQKNKIASQIWSYSYLALNAGEKLSSIYLLQASLFMILDHSKSGQEHIIAIINIETNSAVSIPEEKFHNPIFQQLLDVNMEALHPVKFGEANCGHIWCDICRSRKAISNQLAITYCTSCSRNFCGTHGQVGCAFKFNCHHIFYRHETR